MGTCVSLDKIKPSGEQFSLRLEHKRAKIKALFLFSSKYTFCISQLLTPARQPQPYAGELNRSFWKNLIKSRRAE